MTLSAGTRLGPYEILALLGAGGMGQVYRARDTKLDREVAVKVLPKSLAEDPAALARFEREAKAVAALSHPNILAVHDFGKSEGTTYAVMELLEGESLLERLSEGALPPRKAAEIAREIALGLAAAHEKGVVHRDLKPANLFLTKDGRVKILDFGLARQLNLPSAEDTKSPTAVPGTEPGTVLGTVGYMAPEQLRGQPADHRSDIFSFGAVMYEMLAGRRAFRGDTAIETMNAILKEDPPELSTSGRPIPPGLDRVVSHCLEKRPEERFQSARDLAFDLDALSGVSGIRSAVDAPSPRTRRQWLPALAGVTLFVAGAISAWLLVPRKPAGSSSLSFHQLTFRGGTIGSARFAPDGQNIVYSAAWGGARFQVFSTRRESPESSLLALPSAVVLGVSGGADLALRLTRPDREWVGTLAQAPLGGGSPREILEEILDAAWERDGKQFVVVRFVAGRSRLEGPIGKVLYETDGGIGSPRVSPRGDSIAFLDNAQAGNSAGTVAVVDRTGKKRTLTQEWGNIWGLAWGPAGDELWFSAAATGESTDIVAVTLSGRQRLLLRSPGSLAIQDVFRDGRALVINSHLSGRMMYGTPGESREQDLSWLDASEPTDISPDGKRLLFAEGGGPAGKDYLIYIRATDGSPAIRIGEGYPYGFSPDGKWVLAIPHASPSQIVLFPTGPGTSKRVTQDQINHTSAQWMPSGNQIVFVGSEPGHQSRLFIQNISGGRPRSFSAESVVGPGALLAVSPDGQFVAATGVDRRIGLYPVAAGQPAGLPGGTAGEGPIRWSADGRFLYVCEFGRLPARIFRVEIRGGRRELWKEIMPPDPSGVHMIHDIQVTPDGQSYAYSYFRSLGKLYLVEGLK